MHDDRSLRELFVLQPCFRHWPSRDIDCCSVFHCSAWWAWCWTNRNLVGHRYSNQFSSIRRVGCSRPKAGDLVQEMEWKVDVRLRGMGVGTCGQVTPSTAP